MQIPFLSSTSKSKRVALFDIGSGSVGFAIAELESGRPAQIVLSKRAWLPQAERTEAQRMGGIKRLIEHDGQQFFQDAARRGLSDLGAIMLIAHAPWVRSVSVSAEREFGEPTEISAEAIRDISQEALRDAPELNGHVFERSVIRVELNGYPTASPEGKQAQRAEVALVVSSLPEQFMRMLKESIGVLLPGRKIRVRSALTLYTSLLRDIATRTHDYTILDMTSLASACIAVRAGVITQHKELPGGLHLILDAVAKEAGSALDEARSLIRLLTEGACESAACEAAAAALGSAERKLVRTFGEGFSTLVTERRLPNVLVLAIHPDLAPWATRFFGRLDFSQFTVTGRPFIVQHITPDSLQAYAMNTADATPDAGITAAAAFAQLLER